MPRISSFYGIIIGRISTITTRHISMPSTANTWRESSSTRWNRWRGTPARALRLVQEWAALHRDELIANWDKARAGLPLDKIEPLP